MNNYRQEVIKERYEEKVQQWLDDNGTLQHDYEEVGDTSYVSYSDFGESDYEQAHENAIDELLGELEEIECNEKDMEDFLDIYKNG